MQYFTYTEFDQKDLVGSGEQYMDKQFLECLDVLRGKCGFPFIITSGYRTPEYNNQISKTGRSGPHTTGQAADIAISRNQAFKLLQKACEMRCFTGIGIKQNGNGRFIHLDAIYNNPNIPRPMLWSY